MPKTKKAKKPARMTLRQAKIEAAQLGLEVAAQYDKRFINTWLYTLGQDVEPVERKAIVHKPKATKKKLSWDQLAKLAAKA